MQTVNPIAFQVCHFDQLSASELYEILQLRAEIFVVEQNCPYQDLDGLDRRAFHLLGRNEAGILVAYTRLLGRGVAYPDFASIGRVVNSALVRGQGVGKRLMLESLRQMQILFPDQTIRIGAQSYLLGFYASLGFVSENDEYLEDNIPHTHMIWQGTAH
jgi:ElaA protein